ncbi:GTPase Era [candidate division WOR-3 bacterium JGI_Cruoil_03_51_56]|uniref:GTPase Era n=1 Tax=candidate division WOR-3 bacterium JGI_Cruoil_03_51_56 TaxID=1973747 RepID=A0A235BWE2_UNCW3|nr:MAG: GTPase Era [candidate division WOR-3 bacterium JGI_Cruoil_03_51_56]
MNKRERDSHPVSRGRFKSGYIALVGLPNVGKSTLLNRLLDYPVSIVASRPQTTRHRILGILNGRGYQALFLDTPGILKPCYKLQEMMEKEIELALRDADIVLLVVDATRPDISGVGSLAKRNSIVVINKIDKVEKKTLLPIAQRLAGQGFDNVHMISALKGSGVEELKAAVIDSLPDGEPFYPPLMISERPERFFVAEIIREVIFNRYGEEVPYATTVVIEDFRERPGRKDYINAVIYVERNSQRAIIIGNNGQAIKRVGAAARRRIEQFLDRPVYLELRVKVAEAWRKNEQFIQKYIYKR